MCMLLVCMGEEHLFPVAGMLAPHPGHPPSGVRALRSQVGCLRVAGGVRIPAKGAVHGSRCCLVQAESSPCRNLRPPSLRSQGDITCFLFTSPLVTLCYYATVTDAVWMFPGPGGLPVSSNLAMIELVQPQLPPGPLCWSSFQNNYG